VQFGRAFSACRLVRRAMGLLAGDIAVLHQVTGYAYFEALAASTASGAFVRNHPKLLIRSAHR
jgi:hypothetical protein